MSAILNPDREPAWKKLLLQKTVLAGGAVPTGYGIAWKCWDKDAYVIMPIPFNILTSWVRALWYAGIHGYTLDALAKAEEHGYREGRKEEFDRHQRITLLKSNQAFEEGRKSAFAEIEALIDRKIAERK